MGVVIILILLFIIFVALDTVEEKRFVKKHYEINQLVIRSKNARKRFSDVYDHLNQIDYSPPPTPSGGTGKSE